MNNEKDWNMWLDCLHSKLPPKCSQWGWKKNHGFNHRLQHRKKKKERHRLRFSGQLFSDIVHRCCWKSSVFGVFWPAQRRRLLTWHTDTLLTSHQWSPPFWIWHGYDHTTAGTRNNLSQNIRIYIYTLPVKPRTERGKWRPPGKSLLKLKRRWGNR